jgi:hypothetical protein
MGSAGVRPVVHRVFDLAAENALRIAVEELPRAEIESGWNRPPLSRRRVFRP